MTRNRFLLPVLPLTAFAALIRAVIAPAAAAHAIVKADGADPLTSL